MKRMLWTVAALFAFVLAPVLISAADDKPLTGEPICIKCYMTGKSGASHASCGESCAGKGLPNGLLVDEGGKKQVYLIMGANNKDPKDLVKGLMGKKVTVTGTVSDKDGMKVVTASEIKEAK